MTVRIALATTDVFADEDPDYDTPLLLAALRERGVDAEAIVWHDDTVALAAFDLIAIRSTWDYPERADEFIAWVDRAAAATRLVNSAALVRWNIDKSYLTSMADAGIRTVPTVYCRDAETAPAALNTYATGAPNVTNADAAVDACDVDACDVDACDVDACDVDARGMDARGMDARGMDATGMDASDVDTTGVDASDVDATQVDATQVEATKVDAAQLGGGPRRIVVKPTLSAGARDTGLFDADDPRAGALAERIISRGGTAMIQPEIAELSAGREKALYVIEGRFTHAVAKGALLEAGGGLRGGVYQENPVLVSASAAERAFAIDAMRAVSDITGDPAPLYGRVDVVDTAAHGLVVLEVELIEPALNLHVAPSAIGPVVDALLRAAE